MKKILTCFIFLPLVLACERTVNLPGDPSERILTLNSIICTGDSLHTAFVAWSSFDNCYMIEDASLRCYVNGILQSETSDLTGHEAPQSIRFKCRARPGDMVRLELETPDGNLAAAEVHAPLPAVISSVDTAFVTMLRQTDRYPQTCRQFLATMEDRTGEDNFYRVQIFSEAALVLAVKGEYERHEPGDTLAYYGRKELAVINTLEPSLNNGIRIPREDDRTTVYEPDYFENAFNIFRDSRFSGSAYTLNLACEDRFYNRSGGYMGGSSYICRARAIVRLNTMDKDAYSYLNAVQYYSSTLTEFSVDAPLIFKQNVSGGAGFVTVMSSFDYIIDLPDMQL